MSLPCSACGAVNDDDLTTCFTCGHTLAPERAPIRLGAKIADRYEILERLGKGGMGAVYRARDHVLEEDVALKVLRDDLGGQDVDLAKRFRQEIKLARKVVHRNVCRIYEYGESGGRRYISMELIQGTDLKHVLRQRGALPAAEAYAVSTQVARGLQAIHEIGVIHRDLKAPNIMVDGQGIVRLMDFGIAKDTSEIKTAGATATGHIIGTPDYMSPEQASGLKVDFRSDVYSLGVLVFELFTGELPFRADTPMATLLKHLQEPPPLDGPMAARIPPPLKAVLARALAKNPADRHQSAKELADALRQAEALQPTAPIVVAPAPAIAPVIGNTAAVPQASLTDSLPTPIPAPTAPGPSVSAPTVLATVVQPAPTRHASRGQERVPVTVPEPQHGTKAIAAGVVLGLVGLVAAGIWLAGTLGRATGPTPAAPTTAAPAPVAPAPLHTVRINALPWARVRLSALDLNTAVPQLSDVERTTPLLIQLPAGEYSLELENDGLTKPLKEKITVPSPGDFVFTMPAFDPEAAVEKSGWRR